MPAVTLPTAVKRMRGTLQPCRTNPAEPVPTQPLGDPPQYFERDERAAWRELQKTTVEGVLTSQDRWGVEVACLLMAQLRRRESMSGSERSQLAYFLSRMGMTPADRCRITVLPPELGNDDLSQFLQ